MGLIDFFSKTYRGKKVLITGHTGFKGAWLMLLLHKLGAHIKGYALEPDKQSLYRNLGGDGLIDSVIDDIRNLRRLKEEITSFGPDFIFHLAAQPLVLDSYKNPVYTYETNLIGTMNVLEALRYLDTPCQTIIVTTDKVYENKEWVYPYRETDRLGGFDPYSSSKACAELAVASMRSSFFPLSDHNKHGKAIAVARAGNVIGGGDWSTNRIIPDIARALSNNEPIALRNPDAVRPWQHVLEALSGYLQLGSRLAAGENLSLWCDAWNFGPLDNASITVEQLVNQAIEQWGRGTYEASSAGDRLHEANQLRLDCSKAAMQLGWQPRMDSMQSIAITIDWYKAVLEQGHDPLELTMQQVEAYFS
jgi:CDP-glucose 4,6-dehydratase